MCESCGAFTPDQRYLYFGDGGYTFVVCPGCAAAAEDHGVATYSVFRPPPTELHRERGQ